MSQEGDNNVIHFPEEQKRSSEEINDEINTRELKIKKVQREIENLEGQKEVLKQEIVWLKEELG